MYSPRLVHALSQGQILLSEGDQTAGVADFQQRLLAQGFDPGRTDGVFDRGTTNAVIAFQESIGLAGSGTVDETTWNLMFALSTGFSSTPSAPAPASVPTADILRAPYYPPAAPAPVTESVRPSALSVSPAPAVTMLSGPVASIEQLADQAAAQYGVDPLLILTIIGQESRWNPNARNIFSGAKGLMQLTDIAILDLSQRFGIRVVNPYDPQQNITGGTAFFASFLQRFGGDVGQALAAYNAGPKNLLAWIAAKGSDWLSVAFRETRNYVSNVLAVWGKAVAGAGVAVIQAAYPPKTGFLATLVSYVTPAVNIPPDLTAEVPASDVLRETLLAQQAAQAVATTGEIPPPEALSIDQVAAAAGGTILPESFMPVSETSTAFPSGLLLVGGALALLAFGLAGQGRALPLATARPVM